MPRKATNKTKAWRKDFEIHMMPQEVQSTNDEGEVVTSVVNTPYILKGRMLRDYRLRGGNMKPLASNLVINLMSRAGFVTMVNDGEVTPEINENTVETV